jgi:hydroxylamine dehydrogenase
LQSYFNTSVLQPSVSFYPVVAWQLGPHTHYSPWTLRPPISKYKDDAGKKRLAMQDVCLNCHQQSFVDGHYYQYDALVKLYNVKLAKPATDIMKMVKDQKLLENKAAFSNDIEWVYWELWHHEGRRARMGAAMMGPDYAWWHGLSSCEPVR